MISKTYSGEEMFLNGKKSIVIYETELIISGTNLKDKVAIFLFDKSNGYDACKDTAIRIKEYLNVGDGIIYIGKTKVHFLARTEWILKNVPDIMKNCSDWKYYNPMRYLLKRDNENYELKYFTLANNMKDFNNE